MKELLVKIVNEDGKIIREIDYRIYADGLVRKAAFDLDTNQNYDIIFNYVYNIEDGNGDVRFEQIIKSISVLN